MRYAIIWLLVMLGYGQTAQANPTFTDFLFEDWKDLGGEWGTTAMFDQNSGAATSDLCGEVSEFYFGRAYNNHQGWDRNIPNDHKSYVIFAAAPGTVIDTFDQCSMGETWCGNGTGNRVIMNHGQGVVTKYFHADHGTMLGNL